METNDLEHMSFTESKESVTEEEMLEMVLPSVLSEGACLIKFKHTKDQDIQDAMILTLHPEECPNDLPTDEYASKGCWAWNLRGTYWFYVIYSTIFSVEPWPPIEDELNNSVVDL